MRIKEHWISKIKKSDWRAGQTLGKLLDAGRIQEHYGFGTLVPMLTEGEELIAFCSFALPDEIQPTTLSPWNGFIYTFPKHRGHHYTDVVS